MPRNRKNACPNSIKFFHQYPYNYLCNFATTFISCVDKLDSIYPKSGSIVDSLSDSNNTLCERYWHLCQPRHTHQLIIPYKKYVQSNTGSKENVEDRFQYWKNIVKD